MAMTRAELRDIGRIGDAVKSGGCTLFLGAGVHAPPPSDSLFQYPEDQRPPIGSTLSKQLAADCGFDEDFPQESPGNLMRVGLAYEIDDSRAGLVDKIAAAVSTGKAPSPMVHALARLGFSLVVTTNYDQLFERALLDQGIQPRVAVYNPTLDAPTTEHLDPTPASPVIYKIHGDIEARESLVVTDEDYIHFVQRMGDKKPYDPIPESLKVSLATSRTLFVGYSLIDYNLRLLLKTLLGKIDTASRMNLYSVDFQPDRLIRTIWEERTNYVEFIAQNVWSFVPELYKVVLGEELAP